MRVLVTTLSLTLITACDPIEAQAANDAVKQYEMAKGSGDKMQTCVAAGMVVAAYLQAKDEANYKKWLAVEKEDCSAAGL